MPLPVITNVVRAAIRGQLPSGKTWVNVWHFRWSGAGSPVSNIAASLDPTFVKMYNGPLIAGGQFVLGFCRNTVTVQDISYTPLDGSSATIVISHAANGASSTADSLPSEVSPCLSFRTPSRGRSFRGRVFLPPWTEGQNQTDGTMQTVDINNLITHYGQVKSALSTALWDHVIASYKLSSAVVVSSATMDNKYDVQRRRK